MSAGPADPQGPMSEREAGVAEYVLGTLPASGRIALEAARAADPAIEAMVRDWERRLAPLSLAVPEEHAPERVWDGIVRTLHAAGPAGVPAAGPAANDNRVAMLTRQVRRWRLAAGGAGLIAAGLALAVALGPRPPAPGEGGRFVAVVTSGGEAPALIVSIDTARGTAQVRPVAAQAPAGRSLELWYVGGGKPPQSLGVLKPDASRIGLPAEAARGEGVFAVSVEPPGGSQTGQPTGQVIYQGTLIRE